MDSLGLFTHGEFFYQVPSDPGLVLFTHGEFGVAAAQPPVPQPPVVVPGYAGGGSGCGDYVAYGNFTDEEIALAILMLDD